MINVIFVGRARIRFRLVIRVIVFDKGMIILARVVTLEQPHRLLPGLVGKSRHLFHALPNVLLGDFRSNKTDVTLLLVPIFILIPFHDRPNFPIRPKIVPDRLSMGVVRVKGCLAGFYSAITMHLANRRHGHKLEVTSAFDESNAGIWRYVKFTRWL